MIRNPVLTGFNPDPSIIRVEDDYYMAVSTFEWFPGVGIYHSRDLANWRLLTYPLNRISQLDLRGDPSSGGVWAPALSYHDGVFYLLYTDVKARRGAFKDLHNYVVTANNIEGPWSEPAYLHARGFDPFLYHDDDGRKWVANMRWDYRPGRSRFAGIELQEFLPAERKLIGPVNLIAMGSPIGVSEGPQLLKRDGWYYLLLAEGGTGYNHAATIARSRSLLGPYEYDPHSPLMTTVNDPAHPLQKAGHGSLVETQSGEWYMAHICARPLPGRRLSPLGRETAIQRVEWTDQGWLRLAGEGKLPALEVPAPRMAPHPWPAKPVKDDFDTQKLGIDFQSLRIPTDNVWLSLSERPGYLRLRGQESLASWNRQSLIARRLQHFSAEAETCLEFEPNHFNQCAGLVCYSDESDYFYLRIGYDETNGRHARVVTCKSGNYEEAEDSVPLADRRCYLKAVFDHDRLQFKISLDGAAWTDIGPELDAGQLADDYEGKLGFAGTMIGMCAQDLSGTMKHADFDYFSYREI
ncbi:glycoside hydrolase family 43 protein [Cohnella sp. GbtcB17]|uniref:glycoside hydrolase family 43 protein n=1 Tax=Cohnella sp. GbtcB17 TaxID=2824762 RepID=UPI0020C6B723|nr:glycoside hydrolase family 43 protein [Cohnella sp. GbtcB17]